jgi:hypothetical protein
VLIAIPYLMIVFGLLADTLPGSGVSKSVDPQKVYLAAVISVMLRLLSSSLLKSNPRLRRASQWKLQSYAQSVRGLDDRERLVIDQAFRTSYGIIALTCSLALVCAFINTFLDYHLGPLGFFYIVLGAANLLFYLPTTIVAWKEGI